MNALRPTDPRPAAAVAAVDAARAGRTTRDTAAEAAPTAATAGGDDVQISAEARARAADSPRADSPEIETARVALRSESLSDARLHELRERVRTGHYNQPEVIGRVAAQAAADLAPE